MSKTQEKQNAINRAVLLDEIFARPDYSIRAKAVFFVLIAHLNLETL
jgi:hypothetical protein